MSHLTKNVEVLRKRDPELATRLEACHPGPEYMVESARNGEPTLKLRDTYLHSPYNPGKEASDWARAVAAERPGEEVTLLGLGLGHHLKALAAENFSGAIIEPDPAVARLALEQLDLTGELGRFSLYVGLERETLHRRHRDLLLGRVIAHPASVRTSPDYLGRIKAYADQLPLARRGALKILVINPIYGGSLPVARYCASALRALGHDVTTFDSDVFAPGMKFAEGFDFKESQKSFRCEMTTFLAKGIYLRAREWRPDLVVALAQAPLIPDLLRQLTAMDIPTAFWFVEDHKTLTYWRDMAADYSYFFGIQRGNFVQELSRLGLKNYGYLPMAAAPDIHRPLNLTAEERTELGSPLSFVGAGYPNRQQFFCGLVDYPFKIWGSDWDFVPPQLVGLIQRQSARIDTETCVKIFNASSINLNLHSSTSADGVDPEGDFVNPRTFELAACQAFQLVDRRLLLPDLFEDGELATFGDMDEAREKIDHYLRNDSERHALAGKGRARVLAEHTYELRMEELLTLMLAAFPAIAERQRERLRQRETVLGELDRHEGLQELLSGGREGQWLRLNDIFTLIEQKNGRLSRAEKIFLMLKNVDVRWDEVPR